VFGFQRGERDDPVTLAIERDWIVTLGAPIASR
jgi:hypothetical protein